MTLQEFIERVHVGTINFDLLEDGEGCLCLEILTSDCLEVRGLIVKLIAREGDNFELVSVTLAEFIQLIDLR